jgi:hypothetical protein
MPGVATPWTNRQAISWASDCDVAASAVASVSVHADATMVRRRPTRSANRPMNGAKIATATVGAVIVSPAWNGEAPNLRVNSGRSGCVEYRSRNAAIPATMTGSVGSRRIALYCCP